MKKVSCSLLFISSLLGVFFGVGIVSAADAPAAAPISKCVTASTEATHAAAVAQMNKDIAPYASDAKAANVVEQYKQNIETAWEAMQQPYCGYGAYGIASAVHSLSKSISRARATFLTNIKNPSAANVTLMQTTTVETPSVTDEATTVKSAKALTTTAKTVKKATTSTSTGTTIRKGLHRGMKSAAVTALQQKLAAYYHLPIDGHVTGYYGSITQGLVLKFQLEKHVISSASDPGSGLVGPKTSAALNSI